MGSFTQDGLMQQGCSQGSSNSERWRAASAYDTGGDLSVHKDPPAYSEVMTRRMALLAKTIENEIIPRLMFAHGLPGQSLPQPALKNEPLTLRDVQEFASLVLGREDHLAHACVHDMHQRGIPAETIYLELLAPVARHLSALRSDDLCDSTDLTLGLGRLLQVLRELSPAFCQLDDRPASGRRVLLLPSPGEDRMLGLVIVAEFYHRAGWDVTFGPWTPATDPATMVKNEWFDAVGFPAGSEWHRDELSECISRMRKHGRNPHLVIMVGDPVCIASPEYAEQVGADAVANDCKDLPLLSESPVCAAVKSR